MYSYIPLVILGLIITHWEVFLFLLIVMVVFAIIINNANSSSRQERPSEQYSDPYINKRPRSGVYSSDDPYTPLPSWGSAEYVQGICARNMIDAMNGASYRCLSSDASPYEAYRAGEEWLIYHDRYLNYMNCYHPRTTLSIKSSMGEIQSRMSELVGSYEKEKAEITQIRNNLKSYLSRHPCGYRKRAINAHVTRSQNSKLYYLYRSVFQGFVDAGLMYTCSVNGSVEYEYFGYAVKNILDVMRQNHTGRRKDVLKQLAPTKNSDNRRMHTYAFKFMQDAFMIETGKDEKGFVTYSFLSPLPRIAPCPPALISSAVEKIRSQEDYAIRKALYFVNEPSFLDRALKIGSFTSLTDNAIYHTSLRACTCPAFEGSRSPCKHMIRLAVELNLFTPIGSHNRYAYRPDLGYSEDWFADYL